jgi:hypothetical protein
MGPEAGNHWSSGEATPLHEPGLAALAGARVYWHFRNRSTEIFDDPTGDRGPFGERPIAGVT